MANKSIYWDSCAFIHLLQQTRGYYDALAEMVAKARNGEYDIVTSTVTLAEVYKLPERGTLSIDQSEKILASFDNDYIHLWEADRWVCKEAHHILRLIGTLLPMDAIHLATAKQARATVVITTDTKKYRRKGLLAHDGKLDGLRILLPGDEAIGPLFARNGAEKDATRESEEGQDAEEA